MYKNKASTWEGLEGGKGRGKWWNYISKSLKIYVKYDFQKNSLQLANVVQ